MWCAHCMPLLAFCRAKSELETEILWTHFHFLSAFKEGAGLFHRLSLPLRHIHILLDKATCIIHCDRETGAGGFRNVFSQMWSLLRSPFSLISASEDAVGNENVRSVSTLRRFGFDFLHTGHIYLIASRRWFNSKTMHTCMRVYTHADWRSFLMVSEAFPFTITTNSPQPFLPSHHSSNTAAPCSLPFTPYCPSNKRSS